MNVTKDDTLSKELEPVARTKKDRMHLLRQVSKQRATNLLPSVWKYLGELMDDGEAPHGARLTASNMILDRALGKATEHKEIDVRIDVNAQHLDALKAINTAFRAEADALVLEVEDVTPVIEDVLPKLLPIDEKKDT